MHSIHIEYFFQFLVCLITWKACRKRSVNIIINFHIIISVNCRIQKNKEDCNPDKMMLCNKIRYLIKARKQRLVFCFFDCLITEKDHGRKQRHTTDHTDHHTLCHNNSHISSKCKCHKTESNKTCYRSHRASHNRLKCIGNGMCHRPVLISRKTLFIILIAVQKEDRIVHRHTELKHCRKRLRNIRNLSEKHIRSHVVDNGNPDAQKEKYGNNKGVHCKKKHQQRKRSCNYNIHRHLF